MRKKFVSIADAATYLHRQRVRINVPEQTIVRPDSAGLKTWSAIDYLCNKCKFELRLG